MKVAFFGAHPYDMEYYEGHDSRHHFTFFEDSLNESTIKMAEGHQGICISPRHLVDERILEKMNSMEINLLVVRSSGYDNVDFKKAARYGIAIINLPGYSPYAVAEYATALVLTLNRKTHLAYERIKQGNFSIDGLTGFNLSSKSVGIIGMGRIGYAFSRIMAGFSCTLLACDVHQNKDFIREGIKYVPLEELLAKSDVISIHSSLDYERQDKVINKDTIGLIKKGALLINTSRGKLVDSQVVLQALENEQLGGYGADVYENESGIFHHTFESLEQVTDPLLKKLISHPKVLLTSNQAYFTKEAMEQSAKTVINELTFYEQMNKRQGGELMV